MVRDNFAIFILTHGRANNMKTLATLQKANYSGKWYMIIDNEDKQADLYYQYFGKDHVIIFDKAEKAKTCDTMDSKKERNIVLFARNSCHEIARKLGIDYFLELDDDYPIFRHRYLNDAGTGLTSYIVQEMDPVIEEYLDFLDTSGALTVAFAQDGDFIGGKGCKVFKEKLIRKAMNAFFCKTDRPFEFIGRINEDVNMYCTLGMRGELIFTTRDITLNQPFTQSASGGLTESYLDNGTYVKSFYSVMCCPSFVSVSVLGTSNFRYHHHVEWEIGVPKIISGRFKKHAE